MPLSTIHIISSAVTLIAQIYTCSLPSDLLLTHAKISELYASHPSPLLLSILDEIKIRLSELPPV